MKYIVQEKKMRHENRRNISAIRVYGVFDSEEKAEEYARTIKNCVASVYGIENPVQDNPGNKTASELMEAK